MIQGIRQVAATRPREEASECRCSCLLIPMYDDSEDEKSMNLNFKG